MARKYWTHVLPAYAYGVAVFVVGSLPPGPPVESLLLWNDKVQHGLAFLAMELLAFRALGALREARARSVDHLLAIGVAAGLGAVLELWQALLPWRTMELADWVADCTGAVVGATCQWLIADRFGARRRDAG